MKPQNRFPFKDLVAPVVVMLAFWGVALWGFLASGYIQPLQTSGGALARHSAHRMR